MKEEGKREIFKKCGGSLKKNNEKKKDCKGRLEKKKKRK